jgi:hypothetical protein
MTRWPGAWTGSLASTLLGVGVGALSDIVFHGSAAENFAAGLTGAALGLLLSNLLDRARLDAASRLVADLQQNSDLRALLEAAQTARTYVRGLENEQLRKLFEERYRELCSEPSWTELSHGRLAIPEHRELSFNRVGLQMCSHRLRAMSYQDERFWSMPEGRVFLAANAEAVKAGRWITRIFVFDSRITPSDRDQMASQAALGIDVRVLLPQSVEEDDKLDFVIYDDIAVRVAQLTLAGRKRATLCISDREIRAYSERFSNILERSMTLEEYAAFSDQAIGADTVDPTCE